MEDLKEMYSIPEIEIMEISVETGIAKSNGTTPIDYDPDDDYHEF